MQLQLSLRVADRLHETLLVRGEPIDAAEAVRMLIASPNVSATMCRAILATIISQDERFCWDAGADAQLSLTHWETPDPDLADVPFVALDLETTGARAGISKITEIGAVRIERLREVGRFSTLVNPLRPIPPMIVQLTGISQEMVADAPRIEEVMPSLLDFLSGAVVVAHNAAFDVGFLNYELKRLNGRKLGEGAIDTLPLSRALAPGLPNYRLHTVAEALGAPVAACHRALADAQAVGHVFVTLADRLQERGVARLGELRSYVNPASRSVLDKLYLTRDLPKCPGTYRLVDKNGRILYIGKADKLGERVRSHFLHSTSQARKLRQAVRLVERIDWDEACTPLEALVHEQRLILEHRPSYNARGAQPETYAYLKAGGVGPGLSLFTSSKAPKWLQDVSNLTRPARPPVIIGPFRGHARLHACLDLLQRCYPIRRCRQKLDTRPCIRASHDRCLAPCTGDPQKTIEHDALVMKIVAWLAGDPDVDLPDPLERADAVIKRLTRQRRYEEARNMEEACEHLLGIRRSYASLVEAKTLRFALLWPQPGNGDSPAVRLNLICDGKLLEPVTLHAYNVEEVVEPALESLRKLDSSRSEAATLNLMAVPQRQLDLLLAIRRWFHESDAIPKIPIPELKTGAPDWEALKIRLVNEANSLLSVQTPTAEKNGSAT